MWIVVTLASVAALIILVLSVPLDMVLDIEVYGKPKARLRLSWLFGLVSKEIGKAKKKVIKEKQKPREHKKRIWDIFEILRTRGLLKQLEVLIRDVLRHFKVKDFIADFRVGLGDPADTGLLFALIGPATYLPGSPFLHQARVEPSFDDEAVFEGYSHGVVRLRPIQLALPFLRFVFSLVNDKSSEEAGFDQMEKKEVAIGSPVAVAGVTLIPVTKVSLNSWRGKRGVSFFGFKQPVTVIVVSPTEKRAFRATGEEVPLDQLIQEAPSIKEILAAI